MNQQLIKKMTEKAETLSTADLVREALRLCKSMDAAECMVFDLLIGVIEKRMAEADFLEFCAKVERLLDEVDAEMIAGA